MRRRGRSRPTLRRRWPRDCDGRLAWQPFGCCGVGELGDFSPIPTRHATANSLGSVVRAVAAGDVVSGPGDHACCIRGGEDADRSHVARLDPWDAKRTLLAESDTRLLLIFLEPAGGRFAADLE